MALQNIADFVAVPTTWKSSLSIYIVLEIAGAEVNILQY
jgi:hypothetical protein